MPKKKTKKISPKPIDSQILTTLGIGHLVPAKQKKIVARLEKNIQRKVIVTLLDKLNAAQLAILERAANVKDSTSFASLATSVLGPDVSNIAGSIAKEMVESFKQA